MYEPLSYEQLQAAMQVSRLLTGEGWPVVIALPTPGGHVEYVGSIGVITEDEREDAERLDDTARELADYLRSIL